MNPPNQTVVITLHHIFNDYRYRVTQLSWFVRSFPYQTIFGQ